MAMVTLRNLIVRQWSDAIYTVMYAWEAQESWQLSAQPGELVIVLSSRGIWLRAMKLDISPSFTQVGHLPGNYVAPLNEGQATTD
jgi:hypothetical protein